MIRRLPLLRAWSRSRLALGAAAAVPLALAVAPGDLAPSALRGGAAACAIAAVTLLLKRRLAQPAAARRLTVVSRQALSRDAGVALIEVDGRPVLVGYGGGRVQLLEAVRPRPGGADPAARRARGEQP